MSSYNVIRKHIYPLVSFLLGSITRYSLPWERGHITIHMLPDDVLLDIFDFFVRDGEPRPEYDVRNADSWHTLVHVCQRWRYLVFASPRRLNLRLLCTGRRPVTAMLDIWPTLPIVLSNTATVPAYRENIIAALEHPNRLCHIKISGVPLLLSERFAAALQVPFPELTYLSLDRDAASPDHLFLGGSAPRLRTLRLVSVAFPAIQKLHLSANNLVNLELEIVPHWWYTPPEEMVTHLSELPRLKSLRLAFESPQPLLTQRNSPPPTRILFPALTSLSFRGAGEYMEDFIARIDTPLLNDLYIFFIDLTLDIPISQLYQFICYTETFGPHHELILIFSGGFTGLRSRQMFGPALHIRCMGLEFQASSMARMCSWFSPLFHHVDRLDLIDNRPFGPLMEYDLEYTSFLPLFRPFAAIQRLFVCTALIPFVVPSLQELTGTRAMEVLPELRDLFLEGLQLSSSIQSATQPFIAARQLSGHPVAVHHWERGVGD
ncbi:hypothetical protein BC826DRAFT_1178420 [Russula brevipes]|nr:hypothetical protein BC826DRAFT_1178420 [Russula brevipes]